VCQARDYSYNVMHFQFKASYGYIVYSLLSAQQKLSSRGLAGLLKVLQEKQLAPVANTKNSAALLD
jgi:hypothetical protein